MVGDVNSGFFWGCEEKKSKERRMDHSFHKASQMCCISFDICFGTFGFLV
jgi:hypothetical protein